MLRDNFRYLILAGAIVLFGLCYALGHRFQAIPDRSANRVIILDRWTGATTTRY